MICLFVFDNITVSVHKQRNRETPGGIGPIPETVVMGQALDIGVVVIMQTLSGLSEMIRQNVEVIFVFGVVFSHNVPMFLNQFFDSEGLFEQPVVLIRCVFGGGAISAFGAGVTIQVEELDTRVLRQPGSSTWL